MQGVKKEMVDVEKILSDAVVSKMGEEFDKIRAEIGQERVVKYKQEIESKLGLELKRAEIGSKGDQIDDSNH